MSTAAVAAGTPAPRRSPKPRTPTHLKVVPTDNPTVHPPERAADARAAGSGATGSTRAATVGGATVGRTAVQPAARRAAGPGVAARPRVRIEGAATDRLPVRGCSGEALGRRLREQSEPAPLRLTRRGRMLLTAVSIVVFGAAILVLGLRIAGVLEPGPHFTHTVPVQVTPGQTLWSIAESTNPGQDPAVVVERIADLNNLTTPADIVPGQTLKVPVAG